MRVIVLGAAAGGGFPQWNCDCAGCRRARAGDPAAKPRTQSGVAVSAGGGRWVLLNASPDLRQQIMACPALHPAPPAQGGPRHSPIEAVVLTNGDLDHIAGLLTLRERHAFAVHGTARVMAALDANPVFDVLDAGLVARRLIGLDEPFAPADGAGGPLGLEITAFAVPGKAALYREDASAPGFGTVPEDTVALEVRGGDSRRFFYIPACAALPDWLARRLTGAPLVLFDGTTWTDDEMIASGAGSKTAARMGHMAMADSIAAFAGLRIGRKVFVHINNTNPALLADSPERAAAAAAGWEIAEDGMELRL